MMLALGKEAFIMHVQLHDPIKHLQRLGRLKSHRSIAMRLRIVVLAWQGKTALQIATATGMSRRSVQEWVILDRGMVVETDGNVTAVDASIGETFRCDVTRPVTCCARVD